MVIDWSFMAFSLVYWRRMRSKGARSFGSRGHVSDAWGRSTRIASGDCSQRDHLDPGGVACRAKLLEAFAAEIAHRVHRGFKEFSRVEFAPDLRCNFPECRGHRQPAIGVDIDLADAMPDAADDFLDRYPPGLRHLAAELIERILHRLRPPGSSMHPKM